MTHAFKFLIDTNIVIGLEDYHQVDAGLTQLVRKCSGFGIRLFIDSSVDDDIRRDHDLPRQNITLSKLERFERLMAVQYPDDSQLARKYGPINSPNDRNDVRQLFCLEQGAADFLITRDGHLLRRARRYGLHDRVMSVEDALLWLDQTFEPKAVALPHIVEQAAYSLNRFDPIFDGLRADYPGFDDWLEKCAREHRRCWVVVIGGEMAGIVIRKDETPVDADVASPASKILKLCTFTMATSYRGEKFGEHLLKIALWFAQMNRYDLIYLTAYADKEDLISMVISYGFVRTKRLPNGELMFEKIMKYGILKLDDRADIMEFDRKIYPRVYDGSNVCKYCVPIRGEYHTKLFPEIGYLKQLPLFPIQELAGELVASSLQTPIPGNTIRKVYLCRSQADSLKPGDLLFFYLSKDDALKASQSITTVGVVERVRKCYSADDLVLMTAKRSVFSRDELTDLQARSALPVKVIDFLLVGHSEPMIPLSLLLANRVFKGRPPQSIARLAEDAYARLKPMLRLGFEL